MKNKRLLRISAILLVAAVLTTAVNAFMINRSQTFYNTFVPASVKCEIEEQFSEAEKTKTSIKVENTGNTDAYIRVRLVFHWEDSKGNPVALTSPENGFGTTPATWKYNEADWIYDKENQTFYYKASVKEGQTTDELLTGAIQLEVKEEDHEGNVKFTYHQVVEFIAEVIQSSPDDAVKEAWGVTLDGNDQITGFNKPTAN